MTVSFHINIKTHNDVIAQLVTTRKLRTAYVPCDNECAFVNIQLAFEITTGTVLQKKLFRKIL